MQKVFMAVLLVFTVSSLLAVMPTGKVMYVLGQFIKCLMSLIVSS